MIYRAKSFHSLGGRKQVVQQKQFNSILNIFYYYFYKLRNPLQLSGMGATQVEPLWIALQKLFLWLWDSFLRMIHTSVDLCQTFL